MDWILYFIAFIIGAISMFMTICIGYAAKQEECANRVHFYVARDKNGSLFLYFGKPYRDGNIFRVNKYQYIYYTGGSLATFGLNEKDYANLKWEDEPVEVFINLED